MLRLSSRKILPFLIALCLVGGGIAPANPSCNAECCAQPKAHISQSETRNSSAGLLPGCCSGPETAPCPHMLESTWELEEYTLSALNTKVNPAMAEIASVSEDTSVPLHPYSLVAAIRSPPIIGPGVPIFLLTQTFLI